MRETFREEIDLQPRLLTIEDLRTYLSCGRAAATSIAEKAGASRKLGGRRLFDRTLIDNYLDNMKE